MQILTNQPPVIIYELVGYYHILLTPETNEGIQHNLKGDWGMSFRPHYSYQSNPFNWPLEKAFSNAKPYSVRYLPPFTCYPPHDGSLCWLLVCILLGTYIRELTQLNQLIGNSLSIETEVSNISWLFSILTYIALHSHFLGWDVWSLAEVTQYKIHITT